MTVFFVAVSQLHRAALAHAARMILRIMSAFWLRLPKSEGVAYGRLILAICHLGRNH